MARQMINSWITLVHSTWDADCKQLPADSVGLFEWCWNLFKATSLCEKHILEIIYLARLTKVLWNVFKLLKLLYPIYLSCPEVCTWLRQKIKSKINGIFLSVNDRDSRRRGSYFFPAPADFQFLPEIENYLQCDIEFQVLWHETDLQKMLVIWMSRPKNELQAD